MKSRNLISVSLWVGLLAGYGCSPVPDGGGNPIPNDDETVSDGGELQKNAWVSGRIVYADFVGGRLATVDAQGLNESTLIAAEHPACPAVSGDGEAIAFSRRDQAQDQLMVVFKDGRIHRFNGVTGHDPLRVALNREGTKLAFQEVTPPMLVSACGPIHLALGNADGSEFEMIVTGESICAEWPEWSPDGTLLSYAHVDLSAEHPGSLCLLDGETTAEERCFNEPVIGISHRTWSPDSTLVLGQGFRVMRASDGGEVADPMADLSGVDAALTTGDLRAAVTVAVEQIGWTLRPAGMSGDVLPISVHWGANNKLVFDAVCAQGDGEAAVCIFTYDLVDGIAVHVAGPFPESNTNNHNYSLLCPRWIP